MWPLLWVVGSLGLFGLVGILVVFQPWEILGSIARLPYASTKHYEFDILPPDPANPNAAQEISVSFPAKELKLARFHSTLELRVYSQDLDSTTGSPPPGAAAMLVPVGEDFDWRRDAVADGAFTDDTVTALYVVNDSPGQRGALKLSISIEPRHPEAIGAVSAAVVLVVGCLAYILQRLLIPRLHAIALVTAKSELAQPLFWILTSLGVVLMVVSIYIPYNTFGEDIKLLKMVGRDIFLFLALIQTVWASGNSVADEIEGKTALTVLSKPVQRWQFVLGKISGISWTVLLMYVFMGAMMFICVAYKPIYDARENSKQDPNWHECYAEMASTGQCVALSLMSAVMLASVSVAASTRLPLLPNFVVSFSIYALGNLTPSIVQSGLGQIGPVRFIGQLLATILPGLDHYNMDAAIAGNVDVPLSYLALALLYCVLYTAAATLFALILFEDRDLA